MMWWLIDAGDDVVPWCWWWCGGSFMLVMMWWLIDAGDDVVGHWWRSGGFFVEMYWLISVNMAIHWWIYQAYWGWFGGSLMLVMMWRLIDAGDDVVAHWCWWWWGGSLMLVMMGWLIDAGDDGVAHWCWWWCGGSLVLVMMWWLIGAGDDVVAPRWRSGGFLVEMQWLISGDVVAHWWIYKAYWLWLIGGVVVETWWLIGRYTVGWSVEIFFDPTE